MKRIRLLTSTALLLAGLALTGAPHAHAQDQGAAQDQHHPAGQATPQAAPSTMPAPPPMAAPDAQAGAGGPMMGGMMSPEMMRQMMSGGVPMMHGMMGSQDGGGMMMRPSPGITIIINTQAMPPMPGVMMGGQENPSTTGGMMGQGMMGQQGMAGAASPSTTAYRQAVMQMHRSLSAQLYGDPDGDFARLMIPHHQGAIAMAQVALQQGKDPEIRQLAQGVIDAQEREIDTLRDWLAKNPQR